MMTARAEHINQMLDRVLRSECTAHGREYAAQHDQMSDRMAADKAEKERKRPVRIARELCVMGVSLGNGQMFQLFV